ncbi:MAG: GTPase Era [Betaproteobacteria bacterium]|jgi:GTP-binding protein Era|nr:GTPase Era [Betaproteobacteria bacterium]
MSEYRCGTVAIVGRPNVGKSSLLNALVGADISITSRKAQTTRHRIMGVHTDAVRQVVFVDTPGIQQTYTAALNRQLNRAALGTFEEVDALLWVVEAGRWTDEDEAIVQRLPKATRLVVALNKSDLIRDDRAKTRAYEQAARLGQLPQQPEIVPVSALKGDQLAILLEALGRVLPEGPAVYDEDTLTDRSLRFMAAERIREKLFRLLGDELPYESTVVIDRFQEHEGGRVEIDATIIVGRPQHKPMVIGAGGERIKRIGTEARQSIAQLLEQRVTLSLWVKVKDSWADDEAAVRSFGVE